MRPSLRISTVLWAVVLFSGVLCFVSRLLTFKRIFFEHAGVKVTQREAYELYHDDITEGRTDGNGTGTGTGTRRQYIPKIIHHVFHNWDDPDNQTLPMDWDGVRRGCIDANPDFEYRLWTTRTSRALIATHYPFFLSAYDSYKHPIQRVDAARYFILHRYGGIYLDLDNGCKTSLTPLLYYPTWTCDPGRGALSNNILGAAKGHPFWSYLTHGELLRYKRDWVFPYATISYGSGQWFLSAVWEAYNDLLVSGSKSTGGTTGSGRGLNKDGLAPDSGPGRGQPGDRGGPTAEEGKWEAETGETLADWDGRLYRIMMDDRLGSDEWVFFTQERGGSWINWDNRMFLWIGDHLGEFFGVLVVGVGVLGWAFLKVGRRLRMRENRKRWRRYERLSLTLD